MIEDIARASDTAGGIVLGEHGGSTVTTQETVTPRWIRPSQWIKLTGMSRGSTYRAIWSGDLKAVRVGGAIYINANEIDDYFARHGQPAA